MSSSVLHGNSWLELCRSHLLRWGIHLFIHLFLVIFYLSGPVLPVGDTVVNETVKDLIHFRRRGLRHPVIKYFRRWCYGEKARKGDREADVYFVQDRQSRPHRKTSMGSI